MSANRKSVSRTLALTLTRSPRRGKRGVRVPGRLVIWFFIWLNFAGSVRRNELRIGPKSQVFQRKIAFASSSPRSPAVRGLGGRANASRRSFARQPPVSQRGGERAGQKER